MHHLESLWIAWSTGIALEHQVLKCIRTRFAQVPGTSVDRQAGSSQQAQHVQGMTEWLLGSCNCWEQVPELIRSALSAHCFKAINVRLFMLQLKQWWVASMTAVLRQQTFMGGCVINWFSFMEFRIKTAYTVYLFAHLIYMYLNNIIW
jgi:hypothetical protein